ncbi:MmoB/DmpM family protein [Raineyella sp.]|uniref:Phenol hydroxylase P2 protein n=1 Tax=bioreactor metagenome TaxID=1076179 RepID=A0A644YNJ4_9ZZZZ|nr:MmoB/DmpM family protein [Raineyella sp.]MEA5153377.1 MmoB/DmpM family protein [Raineyella sp.]
MTENILDNRPVSVDLQETENNRALISAIESDNADLVINHFPGVVKLQSPGRLVINRESVEAELGRTWETHEFQMAIITLSGNISEWDEDRIVISWGPRVEDEEDED